MKVLVEGHRYRLAFFEDATKFIEVQFIDKKPVTVSTKELVTKEDGVSNEEVIAMLIDRMKYLDKKMPGIENEHALQHLMEAAHWLKARTEDRIARGVEGTSIR